MVKKVVENSMVAHLWANQSQESARSHNGNYSFEGTRLYSYTTQIAQLLQDVVGSDGVKRNVYLITARNYSKTTEGKHISPIWRAIPSDASGDRWPSFRVPFLCSGAWSRSIEEQHAANLKYLVEQYRDAFQRAMRCTSNGIGEWKIDRMRDAYETAELYATAFDHGFVADDLNGDTEKVRARWARLQTPEAVAKREAEAAKRQAKEEARIAGGLAYAVEEFRQHRTRHISIPTRRGAFGRRYGWYNGPAYLRISRDRLSLETSQGATVPLEHAVKAFKFIRMCKRMGKQWHANGHSIRVGQFALSSINQDGDIVAGCHTIKWSEIARIAEELGLPLEPEQGDIEQAAVMALV